MNSHRRAQRTQRSSELSLYPLCALWLTVFMRLKTDICPISPISPISPIHSFIVNKTEQHDARRFKQNDRVEKRRLVFDVIKIVLKFLPRVFERRAIGVTDLRPTGQPRFHQMELGVIRDALFEPLNELRALRARAYQTHLATQDVEKLRGLVDAKPADDPPDSRHARVVLASPDRAAGFGVGAHRA